MTRFCVLSVIVDPNLPRLRAVSPRNAAANPRVRVRLGRQWRNATAHLLADDDPVERVQSFGRERHARLVTKMGTSLLTLRFDLDP